MWYNIISEEEERQKALRLLRKVELIVGEVAVRLMHLENQVEDFVISKERGEDADAQAADSTLNSCALMTLTKYLLTWRASPCWRLSERCRWRSS